MESMRMSGESGLAAYGRVRKRKNPVISANGDRGRGRLPVILASCADASRFNKGANICLVRPNRHNLLLFSFKKLKSFLHKLSDKIKKICEKTLVVHQKKGCFWSRQRQTAHRFHDTAKDIQKLRMWTWKIRWSRFELTFIRILKKSKDKLVNR